MNLIPSLRSVSRLAALTLTLLLSHASFAAVPADFTVESPVDGRTFRLSEARGRYVILHFLLKTECLVCLRHTREFVKHAAKLEGAEQVFLKPDDAAEIKRWAAQLGEETLKKVSVYRDPSARLAGEFGVPDGYEFHGEKVRYPALIVLDPEGREVFRHIGRNNSDRVRWEEVARRLAELKKTAR